MIYMLMLCTLLSVIIPVMAAMLLCGVGKVMIVGSIIVSVVTGSSKGSAKSRRFKKAKGGEQKVRFTDEEIKTYKEAAGSTQAGIPKTMPFSKSFWSMLEAMTKVEPSLPLLSGVNMRAEYQQYKDIEANKDYKLLTGVTNLVDGLKGLELYVSVTLLAEWEKVWEGTTMVLFPTRRSRTKEELPSWQEFSVEKFTLESSSSATRSWASITKDYNLIHLHDMTAKLFGQKGQICHGMWSMARSLSILENKLGCSIKQAKVDWKKPFYCGKTSQGEYHITDEEKDGEVRLLVLNTKTLRYTMPHMVGTFTLDK